MDFDPLATRKESRRASSLEKHVDLLANDLNLGLDLMWLYARHLLENLVEHLGVVVSRVFSLRALNSEQINDLLDHRERSEVIVEVIALDLSHHILTNLFLSFLLLLTAFLIDLLLSLLRLLQLIHKRCKISWEGLLLHPLPAALSSIHLFTGLPQESILLAKLGRDF